jgi:apolipoprotein N-acyltransferase
MAAITFLVSLLPAGLALALRVKPLRPSYILVPAFTLMLSLGFGIASLLRADNVPTVRVGLAAKDGNRLGYGTEDRSVAVYAAGTYAQAVESLAQGGAEAVLLPEACVTLRPEWEADVRAFFAGVARRARVLLVIGFDEYTADGTHRNVADVISRSGESIGQYVKHRHLPGQDYQVGKDVLTLPGRIGVSICKDLDFPYLGRRYARADTGLLLVPAWDFVKDARLHAQMAWLRGVEGGFSVARCAEEGLLSITDSKGAAVAVAESASGSEVQLAASVQPGPGNTIYARTGDIFAVACVLASAALVAFGEFRRTRSSRLQPAA